MKETIKPTEPGQKPSGLPPNIPAGEKTPKAKLAAALAAKFGPKGKQQGLFMKNVLKG